MPNGASDSMQVCCHLLGASCPCNQEGVVGRQGGDGGVAHWHIGSHGRVARVDVVEQDAAGGRGVGELGKGDVVDAEQVAAHTHTHRHTHTHTETSGVVGWGTTAQGFASSTPLVAGD